MHQFRTDAGSGSAVDSRQVSGMQIELRRPGRHLTAIVFALTMFVMSFPASVMADKASDDFNLGVGFYRSQRYELAVDTFSMFLKEFPEHPRTSLARLCYAFSLDTLDKY